MYIYISFGQALNEKVVHCRSLRRETPRQLGCKPPKGLGERWRDVKALSVCAFGGVSNAWFAFDFAVCVGSGV